MYENDSVSSVSDPDVLARSGEQSTGTEARNNAIRVLQEHARSATSVIEYHSRGHLVIIGPREDALPVYRNLQDKLTALLIIDPTAATQAEQDPDAMCLHARIARLEGHLGDFRILLHGSGQQTIPLHKLLGRQWDQVDLVLDLSPQPCIEAEVPPPGYYATRGNPDLLSRHIEELPDMVGEFEKPRYFDYDPSICAHARNQVTACTRCIDACPTLAIHSLGERIEVDPYLCQGGGSCAAVCPSGAIRYVYPKLADLLNGLRSALKAYRLAGGSNPRLIFADAETADGLYQSLETVDAGLIPVVMDELGALDLAIMLNTLAYGAQQIIIVTRSDTPQRIRSTLAWQQSLAQAFLQGLGYNPNRVTIIDGIDMAGVIQTGDNIDKPADYACFDDKRTMLRLALEHLHARAPGQPDILELPAQAPFGEILLDRDACTLCLACTGVCPTRALVSGEETPKLSFIEDLCVQCGLCEDTCPEHAIQRHTRYLFDEDGRRTRRELHGETPFCCIRCGKPFATRQVIERMQTKLSGHWMFTNERARQRLLMCEDCRVTDLWDEQAQ